MAKRNDLPKPIIISPLAKEDIKNILLWLSENWPQNTTDEFLQKLEMFNSIISIRPQVFGYYNKQKNIRKFAITKQNTIYYRNKREAIEIITIFDSRQDPVKLKKILK